MSNNSHESGQDDKFILQLAKSALVEEASLFHVDDGILGTYSTETNSPPHKAHLLPKF